MKLSEAIRLGAMMHEQVFHAIEQRDDDGLTCGTCALGAANVALGFKDFGNLTELKSAYQFIFNHMLCPVCGEDTTIVGIINLHIGCSHRWTRERIADWVATIEPAEVATDQPKEVSHDLEMV